MTQELFAPVCSIASTKRRKFLWAAWWSGPPNEKPFKKPDAYSGGAHTAEEALREAERIAGQSLVVIESRWARGWSNVLQGRPAFAKVASASSEGKVEEGPERATPSAWWQVLGIDPKSTTLEVKRAFKKRALETHPDQGGDAETFREVHRAYQRGIARRTKDGPRRKSG